jgi:hypothetical protein
MKQKCKKDHQTKTKEKQQQNEQKIEKATPVNKVKIRIKFLKRNQPKEQENKATQQHTQTIQQKIK